MGKKRLTVKQRRFLTGLNELMKETECSISKFGKLDCICAEGKGFFIKYTHTGTDADGCPALSWTRSAKRNYKGVVR